MDDYIPRRVTTAEANGELETTTIVANFGGRFRFMEVLKNKTVFIDTTVFSVGGVHDHGLPSTYFIILVFLR